MEGLVGHTLGQYEIVEEIGRGGMAFVYRAMQPSVGREVAIKVMPQHFLQDSTFLERFNREVRIIAQLQHPRILPIYDHGEQDGIPYIVMAYIRGGTLSDRIRQSKGGLALDETAHLVSQIAEGLDFAHRQGVIHRDFKPSNVLLDKEGNVHLADFGVARISEATAQLTGSGIMGTPAYMAPEMAERGGTSPLVDVYALGVTVYQMVTGQLPYDADTPLGLLMAHASKPIPDARTYRADLPDSVQAVIERAMAKEPMHRYQSAGEIAGDFQVAITGGFIRAPAPQATPPEALTTDMFTEEMDALATPLARATPPSVLPTDVATAGGSIHATPPMPPQYAEPARADKDRRKLLPILGVVGGLAGVAAACVIALMVFGVIPASLWANESTPPPVEETVEEIAPPTYTYTCTPTKTPQPPTPTNTSAPPRPTRTSVPPTPTNTYVPPTPTNTYVRPTSTHTVLPTSEGSGGGGGSCGSACGDNSDCGGGLTCFQGICWDNCICEGRDCGCPPDCGGGSSGGGNATVTLVANTTVCYVYISPTSSAYWGSDWLGPTEVVHAGNTRMFSVTPDDYDMLAQDCSHNDLSVRWGVHLPSGGSYTWSVP